MNSAIIRNHLLLFFFLTFCRQALFSQVQPDAAEITVLTYNIRFNNPADGLNAWPERKEKVILLVRQQQPGIFGLQEALKDQVNDVEKAFPAYGRVGVGRDDGKEAGEFSPVFYNKQLYAVKTSGSFWLSQTPSVAGSRGWDAACNRIVSWAKLQELSGGKEFCYFNTHFDHMGEVARRSSALLLLHCIDSLAGKLPVILTGDFNAVPSSEPIKLLTDPLNPLHMTDSRSLASYISGPEYTYTGFEVGAIPGEMIDYVFVKNILKVNYLKVKDFHAGKFYPSDHLPVIARLSF